MEEIRQAALAYYSNLSENQKKAVTDFFQAMDADGNGSITVSEYEQYLKGKGFKSISDPRIFKEFDKDGSGTLDFEEVITLFYVYATKRTVFCDGCRDFLKGIYFTCIQCFHSTRSYDLCCTCFGNKNFLHHKDAIFYDNYALLCSGLVSVKKPSQGNSKEFLKGLENGAEALSAGLDIADAVCKTM